MNWRVGDEIEAIAKAPAAKGVAFEHYDLPGLTQKERRLAARAKGAGRA